MSINTLKRLINGIYSNLHPLIPERVETVNSEEDVRKILLECRTKGKCLTFKAGGTSLFGQTITNSILVKMGNDFGKNRMHITPLGATFPSNMTGEMANHYLKPYKRQIAPNPISIKSAQIGGIVANNANGTHFGMAHSAYHAVQSMRIILADGAILDTSSEESRKIFFNTHTSLLENLMNLRMELLCKPSLVDLINDRYALGNTCGYSLNALIDFDDPFDILVHLMVGSKGTLGFISEVTFDTVPDLEFQSSAFITFPNMKTACKAIYSLKNCMVSSAELIGRKALRMIEKKTGMPDILRSLPDEAVVVLIDTFAYQKQELESYCAGIQNVLSNLETLHPVRFTTKKEDSIFYRDAYNSLFSSISSSPVNGSMSIIEDVAFYDDVLEYALVDIRTLLSSFGYEEIIWGHLLDGGIHFLIHPDMSNQRGITKYISFMQQLVDLVQMYDGSFRTKFGIGRGMGPFVKEVWGKDLYEIMKEIKITFDPLNILNPNVILNSKNA